MEGRPWLICPSCGYDLNALPEPRCPECGALFNEQDLCRQFGTGTETRRIKRLIAQHNGYLAALFVGCRLAAAAFAWVFDRGSDFVWWVNPFQGPAFVAFAGIPTVVFVVLARLGYLRFRRQSIASGPAQLGHLAILAQLRKSAVIVYLLQILALAAMLLGSLLLTIVP